MKVDEIRQELTKMGVSPIPKMTKDALIKQYLQLR